MPAPVRPASSQVPVLSFDLKFSDLCSLPLVTSLTSAQSLQRDSPGDHSAMLHSITPAEIQLAKQELYEFIDKSSKWHMKDQDAITNYTTTFWYLCEPLITFGFMSLGECEELFLQGFHPDVCARFPPDFKQQMQDILWSPLSQSAAHSSETSPVLLSSAYTPLPPMPPTPPMDHSASAPALPADFSPAPPPAPKQPSLELLPLPPPVRKASLPLPVCAAQPLSA